MSIMKKILPILLFFTFLFLGCNQNSEDTDAANKPNIVFIFADDQTYTAIQSFGNKEIFTPNLDRLVAGGTTFTHAYNMGAWNGAVCVASRAMLNSGRFVWRANQFKDHWREGDSLNLSWGKLMEANGYDTYMTGKWHVAAPADSLFMKVKHIRPGMPRDTWPGSKVGQKLKELKPGQSPNDVMPIGYGRPKDENDDSWSPSDTTFGGFWQGGKHWSEVVKDDALEFIEDAKNKDNPFFMYLAFNAPHDPRQAPQSYVDRYPLENISLPESWQADYEIRNEIGNGWGLRDEALAPFPRTEYASKVHIQEYYAIITHLDDQIGKILDALEKSGKIDNTYIFFSADHGLAMTRHGLLGKQNMYDHSVRVPLMVNGPDVPRNHKISADVYLQDIMATALELGGVEKPKYVEFNSLMGLIDGTQKESHYEAIYGAYINWQRMIRKDGYKLIVYPKANTVRLFDMEKDPHEMNDLSQDEQYSEKMESLYADLLQLQQEMDDELELPENLQGVMNP